MDMPRRLGAEFFGTFWLTFAGCGSAVLAAGFPSLGIGFLGVSLAFGLTVLTMAYAGRPHFWRAFQLRRHGRAVGWGAYSPLPNPGHQCLSQSGAVSRRSVYRAALIVLAGAHPRRDGCRRDHPLAA